mmetsp:Transcript_27865/g.57758  ORF Transcript_27865/g.57758 Transcript_27865/m.57758 type:complete len:94 (+) Transcript_27865:1016-1297(+)
MKYHDASLISEYSSNITDRRPLLASMLKNKLNLNSHASKIFFLRSLHSQRSTHWFSRSAKIFSHLVASIELILSSSSTSSAKKLFSSDGDVAT